MNVLHYLTEGIWRDEAFSYLLAKHSLLEIVALTAKDFNPPLYYWLLHVWMMLFGSSELAMRSLSLLFYVLGVFCIYEIFKVILKKSHLQSALFTLICALNPMVFYYAFEARMYSMLFFLAMATSFYLLRKDWRNFAILAVVGMYTHYFMAVVIFVQFIYVIVPELLKRVSVKQLIVTVRPFLIIGACFLPWAIYFAVTNSSATDEGWITPLSNRELMMLPGLTFSGIEKDFGVALARQPNYQNLLLAFSLFSIAVTAAGFIALRRKKLELSVYSYFAMLTYIPLLLVVLVSFIKPLYVPRYVIFAAGAMSVMLVLAAMETRKWAMITLFAVVVFFTVQFQLIQIKHRSRGSTKAVITTIKPLAAANDVIYVRTALDLMTAQYYFDPNRVFIYGEKYADIPSYVGKILIPASAVAEAYPPFPVKAFVITGPNSYEVHSTF